MSCAATSKIREPLVNVVRNASSSAVITDSKRILAVAVGEEAAFLQTLRTGTGILDNAISAAKTAGRDRVDAAEAFQLHDTFGFPIDLTLEMAAEQGQIGRAHV